MSDFAANTPLGQVPTDWGLLLQAHGVVPDKAHAAWAQLVQRYQQPVRGSLRRLVRDEQVADELNQEFWVRLLRGDFAHATPTRGRFRNLVKTVLIHLVADYYRRAKREPGTSTAVPADGITVLARIANRHADDWRIELIERARAALDAEAERSKQVCPAVLDVEVEHPALASAEKAGILTAHTGRTVSPDNYRQLLHRTRGRFAELLVAEVRDSLADPTPEAVREELAELNLLRYCHLDPQR